MRTALAEVLQGRCDTLGGGVFKKRLRNKDYRALVLVVSERGWIFEYLFAKKDRSNIDSGELGYLRDLAKDYAAIDDAGFEALVTGGKLLEISRV